MLISAAIYSCSANDDSENRFTNLRVPASAPLSERLMPAGQEHGLEKYNHEFFGAIYESNNENPITNNLDSAAYPDYAWLVDSSFINREQISGKSYAVEKFTTYLGMLYDLRDSTAYQVLRQFTTVQCAISKRGHSELIFLGEKGKTCRVYDFDMPDELPTKIKGNSLVFGNTGMRLNGGLPLMLCGPGGDCYE